MVSINATYVILDVDMSFRVGHLFFDFFTCQCADTEEGADGEHAGYLGDVEEFLEPVFEGFHELGGLEFGACGVPFGRKVGEGLGQGDLGVFDKLVQMFELPIRLKTSNICLLSMHLRSNASKSLRQVLVAVLLLSYAFVHAELQVDLIVNFGDFLLHS